MQGTEGNAHPKITMDSYKDKTLILAEGNILLQVRAQRPAHRFVDRVRDVMPAIAVVSLMTAIASSVLA